VRCSCILFLTVFSFTAGCVSESPDRPLTAMKRRDRSAEERRRQDVERHRGVVDLVPPSATLSQLRSLLSGFGGWIEVPVYGEVWKPDPTVVGENWIPFTRGRWVYTVCGWTWISSFEKWGWGPFHFGRFALTPTAGWVWIPDIVWSPAQVAWREGERYVGWAPLPPGYSVTEDVQTGSTARIPRETWTFVEKRFFTSSQFPRRLITRGRRRELLLQTTRRIRQWRLLKGYAIYSGPNRTTLEEDYGMIVPLMSFDAIMKTFSTRALPPGFVEKRVPAADVHLSEIRPDVDRAVTLAGPNSPKKLPPRRVSRIYIPDPASHAPPKPKGPPGAVRPKPKTVPKK